MDKEIQRGLSDRLYDKRKAAALELEQSIRECLANEDRDKIKQIIDQLCRDFAYAVHHPNARNGGLIGLAAAAIALGQNEVASYLEDIIHPVLACFGDQDARVRYYACESMYNIAKVAKGEILVYFNEIFDALCKLVADTEPSVKNGADLLDRLIKDIVSEKAATYVSVIQPQAPQLVGLDNPDSTLAGINTADSSQPAIANETPQSETSFSLPKFIPLLRERIYVINPFARMFLVSWITLLDSIPDLELVSYLPAFLGGMIGFLSDPSKDVRVATYACLGGFLQEIRRVTDIKKTVSQRRKRPNDDKTTLDDATRDLTIDQLEVTTPPPADGGTAPIPVTGTSPESEESDFDEYDVEGIYIPGQDVYIDFDKIIEILISHLNTSDVEIELTVLGWIENLLDISPISFLPYSPRILSVLLPTMAYEGEDLRKAAEKVNKKMLDLIMSLPDNTAVTGADLSGINGPSRSTVGNPPSAPRPSIFLGSHEDPLDYGSMVNALTLHFLNEKEETRVAALDWLIMLHRKVPRRILAINDGTFPALLKTLSDPSEQVVTRDLQLLAQISYNSDDEYFTVFMVNLLNLFSTDRRLLESRGNLIIRQLCVSLNPERIYRTLADILEKDDDMEFAGTMVQNLSSILITAPELSDLRMRLRQLSSKDSAGFFVSLFQSWCHNSIAVLSLCLLAQAYEHAFAVLQIMVDFEISVSLLVQIDKLVQLLESPVFTHLRLQLLEPEKNVYLYKCLYGILMLLPQSSAFVTLRNRLNSVSAMGYMPLGSSSVSVSQSATSTASRPRQLQVKDRDDMKWNELLDKFRAVQKKHEQARRSARARNLERPMATDEFKQYVPPGKKEEYKTENFEPSPTTNRASDRKLAKPKRTFSGAKGWRGLGQDKKV